MSGYLDEDEQRFIESKLDGRRFISSRTVTVQYECFVISLSNDEREHECITGKIFIIAYVDGKPVFVHSIFAYDDHSTCEDAVSVSDFVLAHLEPEVADLVESLGLEGLLVSVANKELVKCWSSAVAGLSKKRAAKRLKSVMDSAVDSDLEAARKIRFAEVYPQLLVKWQYAEIVYKSSQYEERKVRKLRIKTDADGWKNRVLDKYDDLPDDLLDRLVKHPDEYLRKPAPLAATHAARICGFSDQLSYRRCMGIRQEGEALRAVMKKKCEGDSLLEKEVSSDNKNVNDS